MGIVKIKRKQHMLNQRNKVPAIDRILIQVTSSFDEDPLSNQELNNHLEAFRQSR